MRLYNPYGYETRLWNFCSVKHTLQWQMCTVWSDAMLECSEIEKHVPQHNKNGSVEVWIALKLFLKAYQIL